MFADRGEREGERERERGQAATKAWTELSLCVILSLYQRCLYRRSVIQRLEPLGYAKLPATVHRGTVVAFSLGVYIYIYTHTPFFTRTRLFFLSLFLFFLGELVVVVLCVTRAHLERCFREREYPFREFL